MDRPRVLMVGRTRYRFPLSEHLQRKFDALDRRLDLRVLASAATPEDVAAADGGGFELVSRAGALFYLELPFRVARQLREFDPDAVVAQSPYEAVGVLAGRALARRRPLLVIELHGDPRTATRLYGSRTRRLLSPLADAIARIALRSADRVRTVGPFTSSVARELGAEPDVSFPTYTDIDAFRHRPPVPLPEAPSFLFVGVLERYKDVECLVDAWHRVARQEPCATLRIVGDGHEREAIAELVAELPSRTHWHRRLPPTGIAAALDRASALVLPSRSEGLPRIAIEALERGRPVIGARAGGIPDIVRDDRNGLLVEPGDAPSLARAMLRLATDRRLLERLASAARPSADEFALSADEYAERVASLVA